MADVITDFGRQHAAGLLSNTVSPPANYFGNVGTGAGTATVGDTTLFSEVGTTRITCTTTRVTIGTPANNTVQHVFTYTATGAVAVTNAGVGTTNVSGAANIIQKSDHGTVSLLVNDTIQYTFQNRQL